MNEQRETPTQDKADAEWGTIEPHVTAVASSTNHPKDKWGTSEPIGTTGAKQPTFAESHPDIAAIFANISRARAGTRAMLSQARGRGTTETTTSDQAPTVSQPIKPVGK